MTNIERLVFDLIDLLARRRYDDVIARCSASRLVAADLAKAIDEYEGTLVPPPLDQYPGLSVIEVSIAKTPTWSVVAPLWSVEEGRSDLSLELTVSNVNDTVAIELDDLRVL